MDSLRTLIGTTRPHFLLLTPACIAVGVGTAYWKSQYISWMSVFLVFIGALSAHISVNIFNEYFDFKSGLDSRTSRTPFSGGSGALQARPEALDSALILAVITLLITTGIGSYFLYLQGIGLLPLGLIGLILVVTYTIWWVYNPLLSLIAPGLGFGVLMINGTHYALTGSYSISAFVASLVPSFLVSNLLLLNQFPDVQADQSIGRRHYPITAGLQASRRLFGLLLALAYGTLVFGIMFAYLPAITSIALITIILGMKSYQGIKQHTDDISALMPYMGMNVAINIVTPTLMALALFIAS